METVILVANESANIELCAGILRTGGVVAFPIETLYGLGPDVLDAQSVSGFFSVKGRPADNPLIVHVSSLDDVRPLVVSVSDVFRLLAGRFWPGPLTLIARKSSIVPDNVTAGLDTVAVRMPAHPAALALIRAFGGPVAAPSANPSGRPSPTRALHVLSDIGGLIPYILDGGDCDVGIESTVLDISGSVPCVLRPGFVTLDELREVLGVVEVVDIARRQGNGSSVLTLGEFRRQGGTDRDVKTDEPSPRLPDAPMSPGMKYRHYAPKAPLTAVCGAPAATAEYIAKQMGDASAKVGGCDNTAALMFDDYALSHPNVVTFGCSDDYAAQASCLFDALRTLDTMGVSAIFAQVPSEDGLGLAVANRIKKAAGSIVSL